ncbi:hypothetical protein ABK040_005517 [Willaertia magna]
MYRIPLRFFVFLVVLFVFLTFLSLLRSYYNYTKREEITNKQQRKTRIIEEKEVYIENDVDNLIIKFMNETLNPAIIRHNKEFNNELYDLIKHEVIENKKTYLRGGICGKVEEATKKQGLHCGLTNQLFETISCYRLLSEWKEITTETREKIDYILEVPSCWNADWGLCFGITQCYSISYFFDMKMIAKRLKETFNVILLDRLQFLELECKKKQILTYLPYLMSDWRLMVNNGLLRSKKDFNILLTKAMSLGKLNSGKGNTLYGGLVNCDEILFKERSKEIEQRYIKMETQTITTAPVNLGYFPENIETISDTMSLYRHWLSANKIEGRQVAYGNYDGEDLLNLGFVYNWWKVNHESDVQIYSDFFSDISPSPRFEEKIKYYYDKLISISVDGRIVGKNHRLIVIHTQIVPEKKGDNWMYAKQCMRLKDPHSYDWLNLIVNELKIPMYSSVVIVGYGFQHVPRESFPYKKLFNEHGISLYIQTDIMPSQLDTQFQNSIVAFWLSLRSDLYIETVCESQFASHVLYHRNQMGKDSCATNTIDLSTGNSAARYSAFDYNPKTQCAFTYPHYFRGLLYKIPRCEYLEFKKRSLKQKFKNL